MRGRDRGPVHPPRALIGISWQRRRLCQWMLLPASQLAIPAVWAQAATRVASARVWPAQEYTRVIVESNAPLARQLSVLRNPDRLVLDIDGIDASSELAELPARVHPTDPYIAAIRLGRKTPNVMRIVLDLKSEVKPDLFALTPVAEYGHRLVLDLYPQVPLERPLMALLAAVVLVLLIACVNVTHMLLARTAERQKEIAVRTALGAGRARVLCQFLTENLLLASLGTAAGLVLAAWGTQALVALSPASLPRVHAVSVDGRVVMFSVAVSALLAVVFGLVPAMNAGAASLGGALKEGGRGSTGARPRIRAFLVASEFALAFMLLVASGLTLRSFAALRSLDPGFEPRHVLSMVVSVAGAPEADPGRRLPFYRHLLEEVRALPGVESASAINHLPLAGDLWTRSLAIEGRPPAPPGEGPAAVYRVVMPGYFETMRLPVTRGRPIAASDDAAAPAVAVINEKAAREYLPGEDPVGKRVVVGDDGNWLTIVGVVKDAKQLDWAAEPNPEVYLAAPQTRAFVSDMQTRWEYVTLVIRAAGDPAALAPAVKRVLWSLNRNLPVSDVLTLDEVVSAATAQPRFEMLLFGVFAAVALVLAAVGIYGVMNYSVARRAHEIGIRMSLGATRLDVLRMVVRQGMVQAVAGAAVGGLGAVLVSRLMTRLLFGVETTDPVTYGVAALVLGLTALAASAVPARRAALVEPATALRNE